MGPCARLRARGSEKGGSCTNRDCRERSLWRALAAMAPAISRAQTFTSLYDFDYSPGASPFRGALVQGLDGNLYGTTSGGVGSVFKITPTGTLTTVYTFCSLPGCAGGAQPYGGLVLATDGNFHGTTDSGGNTSVYCDDTTCGTVFKLTPDGTRGTSCNQATGRKPSRPGASRRTCP